MKKGFTLIELLVVIAIIAILAAILFPVFAQAKVAAKGAASLSNIKQLGTAAILYAGDYDDTSVINGNTDPDAPFNLNGVPLKSWGYLLVPYIKSYALFQDPLTTAEGNVAGTPDGLAGVYRTQFGYAYNVHSPATYDGTWNYKPTSQTSLAKPAETVLFVKKKTRNGNGDWLWVGSTVWGGDDVNPPAACNYSSLFTAGINPESVCIPMTVWGSDGASYPSQTYEEGAFSGGVAFRKSGQSIVTWADGHAKTSSAAGLAAGTNWTKNTPSTSVVITDKEKYVWDLD